MILTNCAACAAPLPHKAKQCSRCKTRYCGPACQKKHWDEGGHDALCKKIKKGGGAEQYHADKKYKEAVAEAVEKCADDVVQLSERPATTRIPLWIYSASKKPRHCCANQCPRRGAL